MKQKHIYRAALILCISLFTAPVIIHAAEDTEEPLLRSERPLKLMQPLSQQNELEPEEGINIILTYFKISWPWIIGVASGIVVFNALIAGLQIISSGGDPGKRQAGIERLLWSGAGFIILMLAGFILSTLNPIFFVP
jgi:hypothetical protein